MGKDDLSDLLGLTKPEEADDQEEQTSEGSEESTEAAAAPEKTEAEGDEADDGVRERESGDGEDVEQRALEGDRGADEATEDEGEGDDDADPDELKKQNIGLRKEIAKLREQAKLRQFAPQQQPVAPMAQQSTQQQRQQPVPVVVSEDGRQVYVDPVALDRLIEERAAAAAARANAPTPEQIINYEVKTATDQFLAEDPAHIEVVKRVKEVDEFLTYHVAQLAQEGYRITNTADAVAILESKGVDQQVLNAYPELREIGFADFFDQMSMGKGSARRLLLRQVAAASKVRTRAPKRTSNGAKRPLGDQPKALSRKGGGKQTAATSDEREFQALEAEFRENGISLKDFPESKFKRMNQLGKKLGLEGFV